MMEHVLDSNQDKFFTAVYKNDLQYAGNLIELQDVDINAVNNVEKTALYFALTNENSEMVLMLLDCGADPNKYSYCNAQYCAYESPVVTAARLRRTDFVELLIKRGALLEGPERPETKTALQWASTHGCIAMAEVLLQHGSDVNWIGPYFQTALHFASLSERYHMIEWLLTHGAEITINGDSRSPLHVAAVRGNVSLVKLLFRFGAKADVKDIFNFTPFSLACLRGHLEVTNIMVEQSNGQYTLDLNDGFHRATESGHIPVMGCLLDNGADVNSVNKLGESAMSIASRRRCDVVEYLIANNAVLDNIDTRGFTPVHLALQCGQVAIVKKLIEHGAICCDRNAREEIGTVEKSASESCIKLAVEVEDYSVVATLLSIGYRQGLTAEVLFEIENLAKGNSVVSPTDSSFSVHWKTILDSIHEVVPLKQHCKICIRRCLLNHTAGASILNAIDKLPLPNLLQDYVKQTLCSLQ